MANFWSSWNRSLRLLIVVTTLQILVNLIETCKYNFSERIETQHPKIRFWRCHSWDLSSSYININSVAAKCKIHAGWKREQRAFLVVSQNVCDQLHPPRFRGFIDIMNILPKGTVPTSAWWCTPPSHAEMIKNWFLKASSPRFHLSDQSCSRDILFWLVINTLNCQMLLNDEVVSEWFPPPRFHPFLDPSSMRSSWIK